MFSRTFCYLVLAALCSGCVTGWGGSPVGTGGSDGTGATSGAGGGGGSTGTGGAMPMPGVDAGGGPDVATAGTWTNVTANLAGMDSTCGNLTLMTAVPDMDLVIAGVGLHGLWVNRGGDGWEHLGDTMGPNGILNLATSFVYDPAHPGTFWESGLYHGLGIFRTTDYGAHFVQLGGISHNDSVTVDFSDPERKLLLAAPHEQSRKLLRTIDGGEHWTEIGGNLPADSGYASTIHLVDAQTYLLGTYNGAASGVFRTEDAAATWTKVFNGGVRSPPHVAADGTMYWLRDEDQGIIRSSDGGRIWTSLIGPKIISSYFSGASLVELPDGRLVSLGFDHLVVSLDRGATWWPFGPALPWVPTGVIYSKFRKSFYLWRATCGNPPQPVLDDAILRWSFDYQTQ
jgi:hypothetical protein